MYTRSTPVVLAVMAAASTACRTSRSLSPADEAAIRAADSTYHAAISAGSVEGATAFFAVDATVMPANAPPVHGSDAIRQFFGGLFGTMNVTIAVKSERVAGEGNVGYNIGSYHLTGTLKDSTQTPVPPEDGKYLQVFLRQPDGSWKAVADAWNANAAPATLVQRRE
jgi:ketosteroid isomerase-like protein